MNFAQVQTNVENYLLDLPSETQALIPDWIERAVREAEEDFNFDHMQAEARIQTVAGVRELLNEPLRYKEGRGNPYLLTSDGDREPIQWAASFEDMLAQSPESSTDTTLGADKPAFILGRYDEYDDDFELEVYPLPDGNSNWDNGEYRIRIPYWRYTDGSSNNSTNWFTQNIPFYVIFKAAAFGFEFNRDERRAQYWEKRAMQQLRKAKGKQKRARLNGRSLSANPGVFSPGRRPRLGRGRYRRL